MGSGEGQRQSTAGGGIVRLWEITFELTACDHVPSLVSLFDYEERERLRFTHYALL